EVFKLSLRLFVRAFRCLAGPGGNGSTVLRRASILSDQGPSATQCWELLSRQLRFRRLFSSGLAFPQRHGEAHQRERYATALRFFRGCRLGLIRASPSTASIADDHRAVERRQRLVPHERPRTHRTSLKRSSARPSLSSSGTARCPP
ncbi:unnamed protein product, partial [Hapterophycus canaliculatus]